MTAIDVMDDIFEHLDKTYSGLGIYLDLKKLLLQWITVFCSTKTITMGFGVLTTIGLKAIFLTECSILQCSISLLIMQLTCGVPQGSLLEPIVFLIYMNDIYKAIPEEKVCR